MYSPEGGNPACAFDWKDEDTRAPSRSRFMILPSGPLPVRLCRSIFFSPAILRASGETLMRASGEAAVFRGADAGVSIRGSAESV